VPIRFFPDAIVHHTHGRRYGIRAVLGLSSSYGSGQGAAAAKMTMTPDIDTTVWSGSDWRQRMRHDTLIDPLRTLRLHRLIRGLPRLFAFERSYRRCLRGHVVDDRGLLQPRPGGTNRPPTKRDS